MACNIPLKAIYTRVEISSNFTTSDGLNPNDMADGLRRAQAQLCRRTISHAMLQLLAHNRVYCRMTTELAAVGEGDVVAII
jgi:hypothetical protein